MRLIEHSYPTIGENEIKAVSRVMKTAFLAEGKIVRQFEEALSDYIGSKGGVATSNGTLALHLALKCLDVCRGDEVILPSYVCRSALNAVFYCQAKPVICDNNLDDYNISFEEAQRKITSKTKAIIIPHMFGYPADIFKFKRLKLPIIEDCAHSIGAEYNNKKVGSFGDLAIFSFEGTKYIITGEGGMVLSNSDILLDRLKKLKEPESRDYKVKYTYRMTNLQAAIGMVQLGRLSFFIKKRREIANIYNREFSDFDFELPYARKNKLHIFHRYMIKPGVNIRIFMQMCYEKGVKVKQPVKPDPLHRYLKLDPSNFPNTERIMNSAVSVPIYPSLDRVQVGHIVKTVKESIARIARDM